MRRRMMKSKIHRATVTDANLDYVGSISLDPELMRVGRHPRVRAGDRARHRQRGAVRDLRHRGGPGEVCLNGAAARLVHRGDKVIVITYADYEAAELESGSSPPSSTSTPATNAVVDDRPCRGSTPVARGRAVTG